MTISVEQKKLLSELELKHGNLIQLNIMAIKRAYEAKDGDSLAYLKGAYLGLTETIDEVTDTIDDTGADLRDSILATVPLMGLN